MDHLEFVKEAMNPREDGPEVFSLIMTGRDAIKNKLWCAVHVPEDGSELFVCEFELENDYKFPLNSFCDGEKRPREPTETLPSNPTDEDILESTSCVSRPLRVPKYSQRRRGEATTMEVKALPLARRWVELTR